jgi:hypothetical protein
MTPGEKAVTGFAGGNSNDEFTTGTMAAEAAEAIPNSDRMAVVATIRRLHDNVPAAVVHLMLKSSIVETGN